MTGEATAPLSIAVLASGHGSNLQAIIQAIDAGHLNARIAIVISDVRDARALDLARQFNLPARAIPPGDFADRETWMHDVTRALQGTDTRLIVLAGFMQIVGRPLLDAYPGRIINIHPSLLPKYRGLNTYARVLRAGDKEHGPSVHFVTPELDGGPVIAQLRIKILPQDDKNSLRTRVQAQEHYLYPEIIRWFAENRLAMRDGRVLLDGQILSDPVLLTADTGTMPRADFG